MSIRFLVFLLLFCSACNKQQRRISDITLVPELGFEEVVVTPKDSLSLVFNVSELEPFNFCLISSNYHLYSLKHKPMDSLLLISDSLLVQRDMDIAQLSPFLKGNYDSRE